MRIRACLALIVVGLVLRIASAGWYGHPRGDVLLDVGVARNLAHGEGFTSGYVRGTVFALGDDPAPARDVADQHAPLWALVGGRLTWATGSPFGALRLGSLLCGLLVLWLVWRQAGKLCETVPGAPDGLPALAAALVATCFLLVDASGNGSLYGPQALLLLLLVSVLGRWTAQTATATGLTAGLLLGLLWLLNHQALVLLPVPLLATLLGARRIDRPRALLAGGLALAVAVLLQLPWWWRNHEVFGDPFYSVNAFYPLHHAGIASRLVIEDGLPVARFAEASLPRVLMAMLPAWAKANALYLLVTGIFVWPGLFALVAAGAPRLVAGARRHHDTRLIACLSSLLLLAGISLAWPDAKLRYLVPMAPLVALLGVRVLAERPRGLERLGALAVVLVWVAALVLTRDDAAGVGEDARPERWRLLAAGGAVLLVLPLLARHLRLPGVGDGTRLVLASGLVFMPLLCAAALWQPPHTTYHSSVVTPDIFGQDKDLEEERLMETLELARARALAEGSRVLVGPVELLAFPSPALVTLPAGSLGERDEALAALIGQVEVEGRRPDHVILPSLAGWPEGMQPGDRWLEGRLEVVESWSPADGGALRGATLCRVTDPAER